MTSHGMKNKDICLSLLLALVLITSVVSTTSKQNREVMDMLKRLNKPAVKSIKSHDGDIVDCVKLEDQPAFDHPLLKNHTIQLSPTFTPNWGIFNNSTPTNGLGKPISQLWHLSGSCPDGTVPIRRVKKSDILREISFGKKNLSTNSLPISQIGNEKAVGYTNGGKYFGTYADLDVWQPNVYRESEYSKTQIWVIGEYNEIYDSIEAGWHVSPLIHHDSQTRLFIFWMSEGYKKGCYNLICPGFVQVSSDVLLGGALWPISTIGGSLQHINLVIWKDSSAGVWWLGTQNEKIGYWPTSLFSYLQTGGASMVQWGGSIQNDNDMYKHTTTQMGSGYFPSEGYSKASVVSNIRVVNEDNSVSNPDPIVTKANKANCYYVETYLSFSVGRYIIYGGPGRNSNCP